MMRDGDAVSGGDVRLDGLCSERLRPPGVQVPRAGIGPSPLLGRIPDTRGRCAALSSPSWTTAL